MSDQIVRVPGSIVERGTREGGSGYFAVIAVNDDVPGFGRSIPLREVDLERYMQNPVVLFNHDRWEAPGVIGRSTKVVWVDNKLTADFEFLPGDERAGKVKNAWERGFLRAASIGVRETDDRAYGLAEWSIVPVGADLDAVRGLFDAGQYPGGESMDEAKLQTLVEGSVKRALEAAGVKTGEPAGSASGTVDVGAVARGVTAALKSDVEELVRTSVEEAVKKRGDTTDAGGGDPPAGGSDKPSGGAEGALDAEERAELLLKAKPLLADGTVTRGMSDKDILVAALGKEVEDAANRSVDYLMARLDTTVAARDAAGSIITATGSRPDAVRTGGAGAPGVKRGIPIAQIRALGRQQI